MYFFPIRFALHFLLVSVMLITVSLAQPINLNQGGATVEHFRTELPYENIKGKLIVEAEIGGEKKRFLLDTGAPTAISENTYRNLLPRVLSREEITDINNNKDSLLLVQLDSLWVGGVAFAEIPAIVIKESALTTCFHIDGIIGSNLLRNSALQFNAENKTITLTDDASTLGLANAKAAEMLLDAQSSPIITIQIGKYIREKVLFDSGSDELYSMANEHVKQFRKAKGFEMIAESGGTNSMGLNGFAEEAKTARLFIPELTVNDVPLHEIVIETNAEENSRVGARLLDYGVFTLDYKHQICYFEAFATPAAPKEGFWSISPTFHNNQLVVGRIWTKDLTQIIHVYDQIIRINGENTEDVDICALLTRQLLDGNKAVLQIRTRKGQIYEVEIVRK